jgi:hypothetical protein
LHQNPTYIYFLSHAFLHSQPIACLFDYPNRIWRGETWWRHSACFFIFFLFCGSSFEYSQRPELDVKLGSEMINVTHVLVGVSENSKTSIEIATDFLHKLDQLFKFSYCALLNVYKITNQMHWVLCSFLFHITTPTCFGNYMPSSGRIWVPSELLVCWSDWVVGHIVCSRMIYVTALGSVAQQINTQQAVT